MATKRQIAANRANAKRSTGPRSPAGLARSSRNAFSHGLSLPLSQNELLAAEALAKALSGKPAEPIRAFAKAHVEILKVRQARTHALDELFASLESQAAANETPRSVKAIDRYERLAAQKRRRAFAGSVNRSNLKISGPVLAARPVHA